jgi:GT2 family glycosyltransferase
MHADNIAKPGWLATFLDHVEKAQDDVGLIGSSYDFFGDQRPTQLGEDKPGLVVVPGTKAAVADALRMGCWWHISSCAIRVATYVRVGGLPKIMQLKGDWDFMLRVLADGWTIEHIPRSLMLYRDNATGSSSISFSRHMDVWETIAVLGRFHWALDRQSLTGIHTRTMWYLVRRTIGCVLRRDITRLLWAFPAMGCVVASYWSCIWDRGKNTEIVSRRQDRVFAEATVK